MGKRQDTRDRIEGAIIEHGRRHLVTEGAAGLSLRAIARDLGMVSSAVYRYVASRDDLLTLLLVDAYSELADTVDQAREAAGGSWRDQVARSRGPGSGRSPSRPAGRCCTAARSWPPCSSGSGPSGQGPAWSARCSTRSPPASPPAITVTNVLWHNRCRRFRPTSGRVRISRRRLRGGQGLSALGRTGRGDQPEVFGQYGADTLTEPGAVFDTQVGLLIDVDRLTSAGAGALEAAGQEHFQAVEALVPALALSLHLPIVRRCLFREVTVISAPCSLVAPGEHHVVHLNQWSLLTPQSRLI